jgi:two-component system chemotaxis sensor kinase CheA
MDFADQELIGEFVVESLEGLANVESQMLAIEEADSNVDTDLVNSVFRTMHSIKGSAGFLGLGKIENLAHALEEVLNYLRNQEIRPTSDVVTTVLRATDFITELMHTVEDSNDTDVSEYVGELQKFRPGAVEISRPVDSKGAEASATTCESVVAQVSLEDEMGEPRCAKEVADFTRECRQGLESVRQFLQDYDGTSIQRDDFRTPFRHMTAIKQGSSLLGFSGLEQLAFMIQEYLRQVRDGECELTRELGQALLDATSTLKEGLRLVWTTGSDADFDSSYALQALVAAPTSVGSGAVSEAAAVSAAQVDASGEGGVSPVGLEEPEESVDCASVAVNSPNQISGEEPALAKTVPSGTAAVGDKEGSVSASKSSTPVGESTIRVDVDLLNSLMTRVGELVLARNQVLQYTSDLDDTTFVSTAQRLNLITTELQEGVMKTRMQPIGSVWAKFPRVVRDLSGQLGKQVRIEMEGKETELDRTIIEAIKDPLTHLIRNAVDHGIETPERRVAAGKDEEGHLYLRAFHEGGQVNIEIRDDGAGLNLEVIRRKALERGLVSHDRVSRMNEREVANLVLLPGFSTAEKVTSVSGRGVGMDVVKTNIERIGGMLDLQSQPGQGTTIKIKIPLTLAIIPALVVTNGGDRYAIPQASLLELVRLEGEQASKGIEYVHGAPVYRLRGKLLPLLNLSRRLGLTEETDGVEGKGTDSVVNIVVLRANDCQFGLVVDEVNDTEEIVVKPLSRQLKSLSEYAGATIMGDGTVALILDVMGLAISAGLAGEMRDQALAAASVNESKQDSESSSLLVVDLGDERRFAMPISMVSRLETVPNAAIEFADGKEVIQYRGTIMPLVRLSQVIDSRVDRSDDGDALQIVVHTDGNRSYGLVVNRIVDAVETVLELHEKKPESHNLLGTTIINERITDVLNLANLARHACAI